MSHTLILADCQLPQRMRTRLRLPGSVQAPVDDRPRWLVRTPEVTHTPAPQASIQPLGQGYPDLVVAQKRIVTL